MDMEGNLHHFASVSDGSNRATHTASWEGDGPLPGDTFDGVLKFLNQMLMEEDLEQRPCMYQDILALQAAEKSFLDALTGVDFSVKNNRKVKERNTLHDGSGEKKNRGREDYEGDEEGRSNKQLASYFEEPTEEYDKVLLSLNLNPRPYPVFLSSHCDLKPERESIHQVDQNQEPKRGRPRAAEKKLDLRYAVDLRSILTQCAECLASYDNRRAQEFLSQIRQHSSPSGDATQRLAHYFANALEARVSGMGTTMYTASSVRRVSAADTLRAYQAYILACPFTRMSHILYGKSILEATKQSNKIHIIDFGILYGFHWPCLIQSLGKRPSGPPKLHITGIEFPQPGLRPAERVEETGRRLERYCKIFNVPFEYHAIAKKWETIALEDLMLDKSETTIVMCSYRLRNVPDETSVAITISPRDTVLKLIRRINPAIFIHGILSGTYSAPFFLTRFREALHHFSSMFDMFDNNLPQQDQDRLVYEKEVLGKDCMNVIACEGSERVERPDTYKQWQVRNQRAGFRILAVNQNIVKEIRAKVRLNYHKDFLVDEDCNWILQGWKGRVLYALSIWKPL